MAVIMAMVDITEGLEAMAVTDIMEAAEGIIEDFENAFKHQRNQAKMS